MDNINNELHKRNLIDEKQYTFLEAIRTGKVISLYYELRIMLYLGILLFTGGLGYFAYQNMGDIGHLTAMVLIAAAISAGFIFIQKHARSYSHAEVTVEHPYFDFILILVALLIISLFTYVQVYFDLVRYLLKSSSFISAGIFIFMAYRYDSRALLSMGITALAAAVGLSVTPVNWIKGDWLIQSELYAASIILGLLLIAAGRFAQVKNIKPHFRFSYQNFGLLIYFAGCLSLIFDTPHHLIFALLTLITAGAITWYSWKNKDFLFFVYSNITEYIALTYLFSEVASKFDVILALSLYYFPATIIGYVVFLFQVKGRFKND